MMSNKNRPLVILRYLWEFTDEEHPAIITEILSYLETQGIHTNRKTVAADLRDLQDSGWDIICTRSRQNRYFIGDRGWELPELKLIIDAIQAAQFISPKKTEQILEKLTRMAGLTDRGELRKNLHIHGTTKTANGAVLYTIDLLHNAIHQKQPVEFQYMDYTSNKETALKHHGQIYHFSPYDLIWNNDRYYVVGWSDRHNKVVKFRVDRMLYPSLVTGGYRQPPKDYHVEVFFQQVFQMYDGKFCQVRLRCAEEVMKHIIDRFGEDVDTDDLGNGIFEVNVFLSVSPTFYAWVFHFDGKIRIEAPEEIRKGYLSMLQNALEVQS